MDTTGNIFDRNPKLRFLKKFVEINNILMAIMGFILFSVMCTIVVIRFFFHKEPQLCTRVSLLCAGLAVLPRRVQRQL